MANQSFDLISGFYESYSGDRVYTADEVSRAVTGPFVDGLMSNSCAVTKTGDWTTSVAIGGAILGRRWLEVQQDVAITHGSLSSGYTRVDSIFLRVNLNSDTRAATLIVREGTPSTSTPEAPDRLTGAGIYELRLADVTLSRASATTGIISVSDQRGGAECPWMTFRGNGGGGGGSTVTRAIYNTYLQHEDTAFTIPNTVFDPSTDTLDLYIDGMHATRGVHYLINNRSIVLSWPVVSDGTQVTVVVLKGVGTAS